MSLGFSPYIWLFVLGQISLNNIERRQPPHLSQPLLGHTIIEHVRNGFGPNSTQKLAQELRFTLNLINGPSP
jgi:hypothetical protein